MNGYNGYPRPSGPPGIRNTVLVFAGELSGNPWAKDIASPVAGCAALTHAHGAGNYGPDRDLFQRLLPGIAVNPNVGGFILLTTGNEDDPPDHLLERASAAGKRFHHLSVRKFKNGSALVRKGRELAGCLAAEAAKEKRIPVDAGELRIGLNCAGTDTASAFTSHAACGSASDRIAGMGGTVVLSEIPDLIGLGDALLDRCVSAADRESLQAFTAFHEIRLAESGERIDEVEMGPFNVQGGLSTLIEKARVSVMKAGSGLVRGVFRYGTTPPEKGLVIMDGPAMSDFVMTGFMAAGVHLMVSTCGGGDGNRMPFIVGADTPSPILPVLKVAGNTAHARIRANRIDFDAGHIAAGGVDAGRAGERLVELILAAASGARTRTESGADFTLNIPARYYQA